jgi:4a-hydroxytetrahydrobiopterin dehydratase
MTELAKRTCIPCKGGVPPLQGKELADLSRQVRGWKVIKEHHLEKSYDFSDFVSALDFVKLIGAVAEEQGHHPALGKSHGDDLDAQDRWTHRKRFHSRSQD